MKKSNVHNQSIRIRRDAGSPPKKKQGAFKIIVSILAFIALVIIVLGSLTFYQANIVMRQTPVKTEPYASNTMPDYRITGFYSLDETIKLDAWYFPSPNSARGTVILVHPTGSNRLPFGTETSYLIRRIVNSGFNVFTFDQRHSGSSGGALNTFGFSEGEDVIAAMNHIKNITGSADCVLFGIGSGSTAVLTAWQMLPESTNQTPIQGNHLTLAQQAISGLTFDRTSIKGMIFDTPLADADEYIRYAVRNSDLFASSITERTIPYAVRMSAGFSEKLNITSIISRLTFPVLIISPKQLNGFDEDIVRATADERSRISAHNTLILTSPADEYLKIYSYDRDLYLEKVNHFLRKMIH